MSAAGFRCRLCGASEARPWLEDCPDYYLQKGQPADYVECCGCFLVQEHPVPEDLGALYADYPIHSARNGFQRLARRVFQRQVYYRPEPGSETQWLLDYGCGDGTFLREVKRRFRGTCGFEPGMAHAAGLADRLQMPVYSDPASLCTELAGRMDVATAHFVLEHVDDLRGAFHVFQSVLKPGGVLYVAVPNIRSWEARWFKKRWHGLDAPRHLVFPEASHFSRLAKEHGFGDVRLSFASFPNTLAASLATVLTGRCQPLALMGLIAPAALITHVAPQGTLRVRMVKGAPP